MVTHEWKIGNAAFSKTYRNNDKGKRRYRNLLATCQGTKDAKWECRWMLDKDPESGEHHKGGKAPRKPKPADPAPPAESTE